MFLLELRIPTQTTFLGQLPNCDGQQVYETLHTETQKGTSFHFPVWVIVSRPPIGASTYILGLEETTDFASAAIADLRRRT